MTEVVKKIGRPTELTPELLEKAKKYLPSRKDDLTKQVVKLPSIEGLAVWLGIWRSRIYEWEKKNEEFADIVEQIRATQAERLLNNGLAGAYNSRIAQIILSKHGYREGKDLDVTSKGFSLTGLAKARAEAEMATTPPTTPEPPQTGAN